MRTLHPAADADGLLAAAARAVRWLAAAAGTHIAEVPRAGSVSGRPAGLVTVAGGIVGILALTGLAGTIVLRRRQGRRWRPAIAVGGLVIALVAAAGAVAIDHRHARSSTPAVAGSDGSDGTGEGFAWPSGQRPAPPFVLEGTERSRGHASRGRRPARRSSLRRPRLRAFRPLEAAVLGNVERALPPARRG